MIIDCIADLHGFMPKDMQDGDLLLMCGDYTARDTITEWGYFFTWLKRQPHRKKIMIAGNHDGWLYDAFPKTEKEAEDHKDLLNLADYQQHFEYLCDSSSEFEGFKIWGSPWSPYFPQVNPKCAYFMVNEVELAYKFQQIPEDTDILMTHTPPYGILDTNIRNECCGSTALRDHLDNRVHPKLHFFGHIHENHGREVLFKHVGIDSSCYNVSYVTGTYRPTNTVRRIVVK